MTTRIIHISDTHIRNLKYHADYKEVFHKMYAILQEKKPDFIIHTGDIAHNKTDISPEFVEFCTDFLLNLSLIAPTDIILGNHDINLVNQNRQDAISPIVKAIFSDRLRLLKYSGEYNLTSNICLNVLSIVDPENWKLEPSDSGIINIGLYHGPVNGSKTDTGWTMDGYLSIDTFKNFDYVMLGDIHKTNQRLDKEGRIRYAGSTIQQDHGETDDKGFLIWDIESKDKFNVEQVTIRNPKPFVSLVLNEKGETIRSSTQIIDKNCRLRLKYKDNFSIETIKEISNKFKKYYDPSSITFQRIAKKTSTDDDFQVTVRTDNVRSNATQEKLIRDFCHDYTEEQVKDILELNKHYDNAIQAEFGIKRGFNFQFIDFEWDNFFKYAEGNRIDFQKLNGIVGFFGKSFSGKSSIIDSILFTIFGSISKKSPGGKTIHIINREKDEARGKIRLKIDDNIYTIERKAQKYAKKIPGSVTMEAKTSLDFQCKNLTTGEVRSLNDIKKGETEKRITEFFGTIEDFLITSLSSQFGALNFIDTKSTGRKEALAKFLDLDIFERKYKLALDDSNDLRGVIKRLENIDFDDQISKAEHKKTQNEHSLLLTNDSIDTYEKQIIKLKEEISDLTIKTKDEPQEYIDIASIKSRKAEKEKKLKEKETELEKQKKEVDTNRDLLARIDENLENYDIFTIKKENEIIQADQKRLDEIEQEKTSNLEKAKDKKTKLQILSTVPCDNMFPECKFINDAIQAKNSLGEIERQLLEYQIEELKLERDIKERNPENIKDKIKKYDYIKSKGKELESKIDKQEIKYSSILNDIQSLKLEIQVFQTKIQKYEENKDLIDNYDSNLTSKISKESQLKETQTKLTEERDSLNWLYSNQGSIEQNIKQLKEQKEELSQSRTSYATYEIYLKAMHTGGIPYNIIKSVLPEINNELSKVLVESMPFSLFFENDDKKLNIYIQKEDEMIPGHIEMASGTEKEIAALAMRLAFLQISSLPRSNIFILDEPATMLDDEHMQEYVNILKTIKNYFKTTILISHLDVLKDSVDNIHYIGSNEQYAYLNI